MANDWGTVALLAGRGRPTGRCLGSSWAPLSWGRPIMTFVIGHWAFIGDWALVIGHWLLPIGHARYFVNSPVRSTPLAVPIAECHAVRVKAMLISLSLLCTFSAAHGDGTVDFRNGGITFKTPGDRLIYL